MAQDAAGDTLPGAGEPTHRGLEEEVDATPVQEPADVRILDRARAIVITAQHGGPLPPEQWLTVAERHAPGVTKALVHNHLVDREHARAMERSAVNLDEHVIGRFTGIQLAQLAVAGVLALVIALGGIALAFAGRSLYGFAVLVCEVAGVALAFLSGRGHGDTSP